MVDIPLSLRHAIEAGDCVLFLGAGIGFHFLDAKGEPAPTAPMLAEELVDAFSIETENVSDLRKIASVVEIRRGRLELEAYIRSKLINRTPDASLQWLFTRRWRAIFTTNYDNCVERAYELLKEPPQNPISISSTADVVPVDIRFEVPIYHLHGALIGVEKPNIVITEDDYAKYSEHRKMLFDILKEECATSTILYIGYGNEDENWKELLTELQQEFYPSKLPPAYRVAPKTDPVNVEILRARGIETIIANYGEFAHYASAILGNIVTNKDRLQELRETVPSDLLGDFENHTASIARLLSSWTYVNQAPFSEIPNLHNFLRGDRPNWGLIGKRLIFERDIEDEVYDEMLDFATSETHKVSVISILGAAGYGVTTLLMSLAGKLIDQRVGRVFMLKAGQQILEGDIEFAVSLFQDPTFFFVDNAADSSVVLSSVIQILRETKRPAMFILGERLNEWRQANKKPSTREFSLEPLSDPEINRLLDFLEAHSELNHLQSLNRDIQFSVIKKKHKKDLLVVLREATEGKSFDAILEDEYRGISDPISKSLYATVCCFYQHGVFVREELLARLVGIPLAEMYEQTSNATEGVVIYECLNPSKQQYGARTRHRIIATVVWERALTDSDRDHLIQTSLAALNLNYGSDKLAFENFTRTDRLVDSIRSLEGKTKFFETAAKKDPASAYVRQHYARMLLREDKPDLALGQIEEAIKLNPKAHILYHTKGMILKELALTIESLDVARKRLVQSEAAFHQGISFSHRDEYSYQGLAQLFLGWAKRLSDRDEALTYISKAEEVINQGLKVVRVRDGLWIESANIQEWFGDQPSRVADLESAVNDNPNSIIARYLLGKLYRQLGRYEDTVTVLDPIIKNYHDEFRPFIEYTVALSIVQKSYTESIGILKLSNLYGLSDPRYVATLGGMLFMGSQFSEAEQLFNQASKRNFTADDFNTAYYRPVNFDNPTEHLRLLGTVISIKPGYVFVESQHYPRFLCPGTKFNGLQMQKGLKIIFEPAFTPRGNIADRPVLAT